MFLLLRRSLSPYLSWQRVRVVALCGKVWHIDPMIEDHFSEWSLWLWESKVQQTSSQARLGPEERLWPTTFSTQRMFRLREHENHSSLYDRALYYSGRQRSEMFQVISHFG